MDKIEDLVWMRDKLDVELVDVKEELKKALAEKAALMATLSHLSEVNLGLRRKVSELEDRNSRLEDENQELSSDNIELTKQVETMDQELSAALLDSESFPGI